MTSLIVAPHCSTGGMPAYVMAYMIAMRELGHKLHFAEFKNYSNDYTVQRDFIRANFDWSCHDGNERSLVSLIDQEAPDIVHFQEEATSFLSPPFVSEVLRRREEFRLVLTSHERDLSFNSLPYQADRYIAVCPWQERRIREDVPGADVITWEFPSPRNPPSTKEKKALQAKFGLSSAKRHLVQVGLWTAHKRQDWTLKAAEHLPANWQVHFLGNRAPNMQAYWEHLKLGDNCKMWGERRDVGEFIRACDAFVLPSTKELAPISLREALGAGLPCYVSPLDVYGGAHEGEDLYYIDLKRPESLAELLK